MRIVLLTLALTIYSTYIVVAQSEEQILPIFNKIIASQHVQLVLSKGDIESIQLTYQNIDPEIVNFRVNRRKLRIYLDKARVFEKKNKIKANKNDDGTEMYNRKKVTAHVTYISLRSVEIRGEESLTCNNSISSEKFKLKVLGEMDVELAGVDTEKFKASVFGVNTIKINSGAARHQVYRLFGENNIDTSSLVSQTATSRMYGEGQLHLNVKDKLKIVAFGAPKIILSGDILINKNLVLGKPDIRVRKIEQ